MSMLSKWSYSDIHAGKNNRLKLMIVGFGIGFDKIYHDQDGCWIASWFQFGNLPNFPKDKLKVRPT